MTWLLHSYVLIRRCEQHTCSERLAHERSYQFYSLKPQCKWMDKSIFMYSTTWMEFLFSNKKQYFSDAYNIDETQKQLCWAEAGKEKRASMWYSIYMSL